MTDEEAQNTAEGKQLKKEADRTVTPEEAQESHDEVQGVGRPTDGK